MERFVEFNKINEENKLDYNKFIISLDNTYIQQECDKKFDFLLSGLLENKQDKR